MFQFHSLTLGRFAAVCTLVLSINALPVSAQNVVVASGQPVCARCGHIHVPNQNRVLQTTAISPNYSVPGQVNSSIHGGVSNVLSTLNAQRARSGIGLLRHDASLQAVAERRASLMASQGIKSHPSGSFAPGRFEGVGWSSSYSPTGVSACFTNDSRMTVAGAAMATGRDGVYFCVVYR